MKTYLLNVQVEGHITISVQAENFKEAGKIVDEIGGIVFPRGQIEGISPERSKIVKWEVSGEVDTITETSANDS